MDETNECPVCKVYKTKDREFCMECIDWQSRAIHKAAEEKRRKQIQARVSKWGNV